MSNISKTVAEGRINSVPSLGNLDKLADSYFKKAGFERSLGLELSRLPQFLQEYVKLAHQQTDAIPGALITAWLPAIAVNIGNRVYIRGNGKKNYCQIWSVLVGPSSVSRKSTCLRLANRTLQPYQKSLMALDAGERSARELVISNVTNAKMVSLLAANPVRLFEFHEFGTLLKGASQSYNAGMKENLTALYDGDSKTICNMERTERIIKPALSVVGASTEGWIYSGFQSAAEQGSGFLQRFVYCIIKADGKKICSKLEEIEAEFSQFYEYERIFSLFRSISGSYQLKLGKELRLIWLAEHDRVLNDILAREDEELLAYATRIYNNVFCALVIIFTLMKNQEILRQTLAPEKGNSASPGEAQNASSPRGLSPETLKKLSNISPTNKLSYLRCIENLIVSKETVHEALYLCQYYLDNARPMLTIITEGGAWNNERRIIKHLAKQPEQKDTHSNIMNKLRLKSKVMKECMQNLCEQHAIQAESIPSIGTYKNTLVYRLLPAAENMYS